jgi:hypothetical protein
VRAGPFDLGLGRPPALPSCRCDRSMRLEGPRHSGRLLRPACEQLDVESLIDGDRSG